MSSPLTSENVVHIILQLCAAVAPNARTSFLTSTLWKAICKAYQSDGIQDALPDGHFRSDLFDMWFRNALREATHKGYLAPAGVERLFLTDIGRTMAEMHPLPEALAPLAEYLQATAPKAPVVP
ncbi:MAG: hypothetical protein WCV86_04700 [Patescibacteria group bacterium]|jgi:hypothetical protein